MSTVTGRIQAIRRGEDQTDPQYGRFSVYYLDIETPGDNIEGGRLRAKSYEPKVGEEITVEVKKGQYGPLLRRITEQSTGQTSGGGQRPQGGGRRDANGRSIERQVALKAAVEHGTAAGLNERQILNVAQQFDDFLATSARPRGAGAPDVTAEQGAAKGTDSGTQASADGVSTVDSQMAAQAQQEALIGDGSDLPF